MAENNNYYWNEEILYISSFTGTVYIKKHKEVSSMDFDVNKIKEFYGELLAEKDKAVATALATKDQKVAERFEQEKARIEEEVIAEIVAEAEAPYLHDIELCEKFIIVPEVEEQDEENVTE